MSKTFTKEDYAGLLAFLKSIPNGAHLWFKTNEDGSFTVGVKQR